MTGFAFVGIDSILVPLSCLRITASIARSSHCLNQSHPSQKIGHGPLIEQRQLSLLQFHSPLSIEILPSQPFFFLQCNSNSGLRF